MSDSEVTVGTAATKGKLQARQAANRVRVRKEQERQRERRRIVLFASAGIVALFAVIAIAMLRGGDSDDSPSSGYFLPAVVAAEPLDAAIPREGRSIGDPNAPVTLVEWADYQCPFCGAFAREIMPRLIEDFVKTGKVRVEFRDLPFLDSVSGYGESDMAAEAATCAADQGRFWDYHDTIFANQFGENQGAFSKKRLIRMAELTGLDVPRFTACFENRAHAQFVQAMQEEAVALGITSTPTLVVNGAIVRYTGRYEDLKGELDAILAAR